MAGVGRSFNPIRTGMSLRELFRRYPGVRSLLNQYGLQGRGGTEGPIESIRMFARSHDVDQSQLMDEIGRMIKNTESKPWFGSWESS